MDWFLGLAVGRCVHSFIKSVPSGHNQDTVISQIIPLLKHINKNKYRTCVWWRKKDEVIGVHYFRLDGQKRCTSGAFLADITRRGKALNWVTV